MDNHYLTHCRWTSADSRLAKLDRQCVHDHENRVVKTRQQKVERRERDHKHRAAEQPEARQSRL